jgi:hypothetical protein
VQKGLKVVMMREGNEILKKRARRFATKGLLMVVMCKDDKRLGKKSTQICSEEIESGLDNPGCVARYWKT